MNPLERIRRVVSARGELRRLKAVVARKNRRIAHQRASLERVRARNKRLKAKIAKANAERDLAREQIPSTTAIRAVPGVDRLQLRRQCVLASVEATAEILEIGPAHNAILPKREGYHTRTVDYLDREGLVRRYQDFSQYKPEDIEEVDYVLPPGATMADFIPDQFDLVVASHVIEHTTSIIDFVNEVERLLTPGGVLALVVPDHRYCFDRFRERAALGRVIDASLDPPAVHTPGSVIEEKLNATRFRETTAWAPAMAGEYALIYSAEQARNYGDEARKADRYIDTHNWISTPHHMRLLLHDLHALGFIRLRETFFRDTVRHEYFINLTLDGPGPGETREELLALSEQERRSVDLPAFVAAD